MLSRSNYQLALGLLILSLLAASVVSVAITNADTRTPLTNQLDVGSSGTDVSNLQAFLATNSHIYPAGLVTGFYGPLTQTAVAQFQIGYGLPAVGRVGPMTLAKINSIIASGAPLDISAPSISNLNVTRASGTATISWLTDELTRGVVFYSLNPVVSNEISVALTDPITTGTPVSDGTIGTTHAIVLTGLQSGLTYYYVVHATDVTGNVTITLTQSFVAQ